MSLNFNRDSDRAWWKKSGLWILLLLLLFGMVYVIIWQVPFYKNAIRPRWYSQGDILTILFAIVSVLVPWLMIRVLKVPLPRWELNWKVVLGILTTGLLASLNIAWVLTTREAPTIKFADMLPIMDIMGGRFITGEDPYAIIPEIWGGMPPIYLPAYWMPYTISNWLSFDPRYINFVVFYGAILLTLFRYRKNGIWLLLSMIPIGAWFLRIHLEHPHIFTQLPEILVIGYYILLANALASKKQIPIAICLTLCTLSRYSFLLWIPTLIWYLWTNYSRKDFWQIGILTSVLGVFMMWISGAFAYLDFLLSIPNQYFIDVGDPAKGYKYTALIYEGLGLMRFFYPHNLELLKPITLILGTSLPFAVYWKGRNNAQSAILIALLLALIVFCNFLIGPYIYLFFVIPFVGMVAFNQMVWDTGRVKAG